MNIKISIVIPVYRVEKYIMDCLESVTSQSMNEDIECILVDDCGGDKSIQIAELFIENYHGSIVFHILKHSQNKGLSAARNSALRLCKGEYVYFLDGDDQIFPSTMSNMWELVEKYPGVDMVKGVMVRDKGDTNDIINPSFPEFTNNINWIRNKICGFKIGDSACNRLIRTDFIKENSLYFMEGHTQEDTIWTFDIQKHIRSIAFCRKITYFYRMNPDSIMNSLTYETRAKDFARVHNITCKKMLNTKIEKCEVHFLSLLATITNLQVGLKGITFLINRNNYLAVYMYKLQYVRATSRYFIVRAMAELLLRVFYNILSYKKFFKYKVG